MMHSDEAEDSQRLNDGDEHQANGDPDSESKQTDQPGSKRSGSSGMTRAGYRPPSQLLGRSSL
jgi:hypothetical protein